MEVIWSAKARITYLFVIDYLSRHWSKKEIKEFELRTQKIIDLIKKFPEIFPQSLVHGHIRRAVIDKNNSLFYKIEFQNNKILLITFFDNRQNPDRIKY